MGGTAQQYHDTDLTGYDTDLNTRGDTETKILRAISIWLGNNNIQQKMLPA